MNEKEYFDRLVEMRGDTWWGNKTPAGIKRSQRRALLVSKALSRFSDPIVLELGCGAGTFSKMILEKVPSLRMRCCDISKKAVETAAQRCKVYTNAIFEVADVSALPFQQDSFHAVVGNSILHHLNIQKTLRECMRVLKPGGIIWFSEPNMINPQIAIEKNIRFIGRLLENTLDETAFFRWSLKRTLKEMGFKDVSVEPFDFLHPLIPYPLISFFEVFGSLLERVPLIREFGGSLIVFASKGCHEGL